MKYLKLWAYKLFESKAVTRFGLAALPMIAGISYATSQWQFIAFASFSIPLLLLGIRPVQARPYRLQLSTDGEAGIDAALNDGLAKSDAHTRCAAIMLELDSPEELRNAWGPTGIETIMSELTDRLCAVLREGDTVARLNETQLALSVPKIRTPELGAVISLIERLQVSAREAISVDNSNAYVTVSSGFCLEAQAPEHTAASMRQSAILALMDARSKGPDNLRGFSSNTPTHINDCSTMSNDVLRALTDGEIVAWYQPQISTDTGMITGFEALARWDHPTRGLLSPAEFLPSIEAGNALEQLSETMLQHALRAIRAWDIAGHKIPSVAVNFATQDLRNPGLIERIKWDVDRFDLRPERLTVEILETVISEDDDIVTRNIRALGKQGYRIDLDDFGTGHASLANIRRFAVDRVKIDRSFITRADEDPDQQRMVNAIISMADQLQIETLAEGVETVGEKSILSQLGCTHMQGYAIAKPMPFEQTTNWITEHQSNVSHTSCFPRRIG
ncbi:MAG: bifunctional diguanylate cyclase/phosphodiesterase [Litoreibacter sp.]|uniref:putative bifunctional diguanylate cyclase/phosphodiesterase n=1 Tax=Litoreibacter sp. TaxID=1969459 RepID=UPI0032978B70